MGKRTKEDINLVKRTGIEWKDIDLAKKDINLAKRHRFSKKDIDLAKNT